MGFQAKETTVFESLLHVGLLKYVKQPRSLQRRKDTAVAIRGLEDTVLGGESNAAVDERRKRTLHEKVDLGLGLQI